MSPLTGLLSVTFTELITDFQEPIIARALLVGALVSLSSAMLGVILVLKRYALIGHGLGEVGFASAAVASLLGLADFSLAVSIPLVCVSSILIMRLDRKSGMGGDVLIGIFSTSALALGVIASKLTTGYTGIFNSMFGSIFGLTDGYVWAAAILSIVIVALFVLLYNRLFCVTFDETYARASDMNADMYQFIISLLTSVSVVLGMKVMGAMMISNFIIFPALTARRLARSFKGMIVWAVISALVSFLCGMIISYITNMPTGACVVVFSLALMLAVTGITSIKLHK